MHPVSHIPSCRGFCCNYSLCVMSHRFRHVASIRFRHAVCILCCTNSLCFLSLRFRHAVVFAVLIHCASCLSHSVMPWFLLYLFTVHHVSHIPSCRGFCCSYSLYIMSIIFRHAVVFAVIIHCTSCLSYSVMPWFLL